jgi:hypothetical protein
MVWVNNKLQYFAVNVAMASEAGWPAEGLKWGSTSQYG